jgi:transposase
VSYALRTRSHQRDVKPWPPRPRASLVRPPSRPERFPLLSDAQWARVAPILARGGREGRGGRTGSLGDPAATRRAAEGMLWVLRNGAPWSALPGGPAAAIACRRRWRAWLRDGRWLDFWGAYLRSLGPRGWLAWSRALLPGGEALASPFRRDRTARRAWWLASAQVFLREAGRGPVTTDRTCGYRPS